MKDEELLKLYKRFHEKAPTIFRIVAIGFLAILFSRDGLFTIMESSLMIILILVFIMDDIHKLVKKSKE